MRWCRGLMNYLADWEWTLESLPARFFNWRSRSNSLTWGVGDYPQLDQSYDLLVVTSMVDLSALKGFRPGLARVPSVVYFHENQFAYPAREQQQGLLEIQLTSIYTALAADQVVFNSRFNCDSFLAGARALLAKMPDAVPANIIGRIKAKSQVLPVPLEDELFEAQIGRPSTSAPVELLWNHRWEWDKGPERLLMLAEELAERGYLGPGFKLHVVGEQFRQIPEPFNRLRQLLDDHDALGHWGYGESLTDYRDLLARSHAVISTATHDFQGLSMIEAALLGCVPFAPGRLAYPEWFNREHLYTSLPDKPQHEAEKAAAALIQWFYPEGLAGEIAHYPDEDRNQAFLHLSWRELGPLYRDLLT